MKLKLAAEGTITECRETLNAEIAALPMPESQANKVVRMIAHYIVQDYLDPAHDEWQRTVQSVRAANVAQARGGLGASLQEPAEPRARFTIDCSIVLG